MTVSASYPSVTVAYSVSIFVDFFIVVGTAIGLTLEFLLVFIPV